MSKNKPSLKIYKNIYSRRLGPRAAIGLRMLIEEVGLDGLPEINSTYRDTHYNKKIGGGKRSKHLEGHAIDFNDAESALYDFFFENYVRNDTKRKLKLTAKGKQFLIDHNAELIDERTNNGHWHLEFNSPETSRVANESKFINGVPSKNSGYPIYGVNGTYVENDFNTSDNFISMFDKVLALSRNTRDGNHPVVDVSGEEYLNFIGMLDEKSDKNVVEEFNDAVENLSNTVEEFSDVLDDFDTAALKSWFSDEEIEVLENMKNRYNTEKRGGKDDWTVNDVVKSWKGFNDYGVFIDEFGTLGVSWEEPAEEGGVSMKDEFMELVKNSINTGESLDIDEIYSHYPKGIRDDLKELLYHEKFPSKSSIEQEGYIDEINYNLSNSFAEYNRENYYGRNFNKIFGGEDGEEEIGTYWRDFESNLTKYHSDVNEKKKKVENEKFIDGVLHEFIDGKWVPKYEDGYLVFEDNDDSGQEKELEKYFLEGGKDNIYYTKGDEEFLEKWSKTGDGNGYTGRFRKLPIYGQVFDPSDPETFIWQAEKIGRTGIDSQYVWENYDYDSVNEQEFELFEQENDSSDLQFTRNQPEVKANDLVYDAVTALKAGAGIIELSKGLKEIKQEDMPGLTDAWHDYVGRLKQMSAQGFSAEEEANNRKQLDDAYASSVRQVFRKSGGSASTALAGLGILNQNKVNGLIELAAKDQEIKRDSNKLLGDALSKQEQFLASRGEIDRKLKQRNEERQKNLRAGLGNILLNNANEALEFARQTGPGTTSSYLINQLKDATNRSSLIDETYIQNLITTLESSEASKLGAPEFAFDEEQLNLINTGNFDFKTGKAKTK